MGFYRRIYDSFTKFGIYSEIAFQKKGQTLKYFFALFTILFLLGSLRVAYDFNVRTTAIIESARDKVPQFQFANGVLNVEGKQPVILKGENNTVIIIDTTGKTTESELGKYSEGVYISRHLMVTKQNFETREIKFSNFKKYNFDKAEFIRLLPKLKWIIIPVGAAIYFFAVIWSLITTILLAIVGGLLVNRQNKDKISFGNLWNISVYALTLPWILEAVKNLTFPNLPYFFIIKWAIAIIILNKAIEVLNTKFTGTNEPPRDVLV